MNDNNDFNGIMGVSYVQDPKGYRRLKLWLAAFEVIEENQFDATEREEYIETMNGHAEAIK